MVRSGWVVVGGVLVVACSAATGGGVVTDAGGGAAVDGGAFVLGDSARGDALAPTDPARLVRGRASYKDRYGVAVDLDDGWTDTRRNEVCAPVLHNDGAVRCFPVEATEPWSLTVFEESSGGRSRFADADCTVPAIVTDAAWKVAPKYLRRAYDGPEPHYALHTVAKSAAAEYFEGPVCDAPPDGGARDALPPLDAACGSCRRVALPTGGAVYAVSGEVRGEELGAFVVY